LLQWIDFTLVSEDREMSVDPNELMALPVAEKLRIVELLWDNLGDESTAIPLPEWVEREALRRRNEMKEDLAIGRSHSEVWKRISSREG
jgi:putative addiction module component (TIGR02574 family)